MYMIILMLGQSLMVTGFIMLYAKISPHYNVLHEALCYCFKENHNDV